MGVGMTTWGQQEGILRFTPDDDGICFRVATAQSRRAPATAGGVEARRLNLKGSGN